MDGNRPRVTPHEFQHFVRPSLSHHGFTEHQINQVEMAFHSNLERNPHLPSRKAGVDSQSLAQTMQFMRAHPGAIAIGAHHWDIVEQVMQNHIDKRE
jgi:hypothetical protein